MSQSLTLLLVAISLTAYSCSSGGGGDTKDLSSNEVVAGSGGSSNDGGSSESSGGGSVATDAISLSASSAGVNPTQISSANVTSISLQGSCDGGSGTISIRNIASEIATTSCAAGNFSQSVDLTSLAEGAVALTLVNGSAQATYNATKDTVAPTAVATINLGAVPGNLTSSPTISWSVDSADSGSGLQKYQVAILRTSDNAIIAAYQDFTKGSAVTVNLASNVSYFAQVKAIDNYGNESTEVSSSNWTSATVVGDSISLATSSAGVNPTQISSTNVASISLQGSCDGGSGTISIRNIASEIATTSCAAGNFSQSVDLTSLAEGAVALTLVNGSAQATYNATKDTVAPTAVATINLGAVPGNLTSSPTISWSVDSTDSGSGLQKYQVAILRTSDNAIIAAYQDFTKGNALTVTLASNTDYFVRVKSFDNYGNESSVVSSANWTSFNSPPPVYTNCPSEYEYVAPNALVSTAGFCVAKYEMKNNGSGVAVSQVSGAPWVVTKAEAVSACSAISQRLISNAEWNAVAISIHDNSNNVSGGNLSQGLNTWQAAVQPTDTASSARTFYLGTGVSKPIYDFGGNAWEWVLDDINLEAAPFFPTIGTGIVIENNTYWFPVDSHNRTVIVPNISASSPGKLGNTYIASPGSTNLAARGGSICWGGTGGGIFSIASGFGPSVTSAQCANSTGFRCVTDPIP